MARNVGSASVSIVPDVSKLQATIRAAVAHVPPIDIQVNADTARARAELDALTRKIRRVKIGVDVDATGAAARAKKAGEAAGGAYGDAFRTRIVAAMRAMPDIKLGANATAAEQQIAGIKGQLEELSKKRIGIDVDARTATADIENLKRELESIRDNETAHIQVRVDAAAAAAQLKEIEKDIRKKIEVEADTDKAEAEIDTVARDRTAHVDVDTSRGLASISSLLAAGVALGPALIPVGAAITAAFASVGPAIAAGVAGGGVLALGFSGITGALKDLSAAHKAASGTAAQQATANKKLKESLQGLGPAGAEFTRFLYSLGPKSRELRATAQAGLLPGVERGIKSLLPFFPQLNKFVGSLAREMGSLAQAGLRSLGSPFWRTFFRYLASTAGPIIHGFAIGLGNLAKGFAGIILAFDPFARDLGGGLLGLTAKFERFGTTLRSNKGFQAFLAYAREQGPRVVAVLGSIAAAVGHIVVSLAGIGGGVLGGIGKLADIIKKIDPKVLQDIYFGFVAVAAGAKAFSFAMKGVGAATAILSGGPVTLAIAAIAAIGVGLFLAYRHSKTFRDFVNNRVLPILREFWGMLQDKVGPVLRVVADNIRAGVTAALDKLESGYRTRIAPALASLRKNWDENSDSIRGLFSRIGQLVAGFVKLWSYLMKRILPILATTLVLAVQGVILAIGKLIAIVNTIAGVFAAASKAAVRAFLAIVQPIVDGAARAFGWVPGLGPKLKTAAAQFDSFAAQVRNSLSEKSIPNRNIIISAGVRVDTTGWSSKLKYDLRHQGLADGGPVLNLSGKGRRRHDTEPAMLRVDEHVWTPEEVDAAGGHGAMFRMRALAKQGRLRGYAGGGAVGVSFSAANTDLAFSALNMRLNEFAVGFGKVVQGAMQKIAASVPAFTGSGAVSRWSPVVLQALAALHQPAGLLGAVLRRIKFESGGNPTAINLTDSNAQAGHPSQGLMQTIPSTFAAYAGPFRARGITDGLANIYAALNYALHRYHSISAIDPLVRPRGYDSGGWLQPGLSLAYNGTQKPEPILTSEQWQAMMRGGGRDSGPTVAYNGPVYTMDINDLMREQRRAMSEAATMYNLRALVG